MQGYCTPGQRGWSWRLLNLGTSYVSSLLCLFTTSGCYSSVQPFHVLSLTHDCIMTLLGQEGLAYNTPLECVRLNSSRVVTHECSFGSMGPPVNSSGLIKHGRILHSYMVIALEAIISSSGVTSRYGCHTHMHIVHNITPIRYNSVTKSISSHNSTSL